MLKRGDFRDRPMEFMHAAKHAVGPVLEIGCAFGMFSDYLGLDTAYVGVDIGRDFVRESRRRHPRRVFLLGDVRVLAPILYRAFRTVVFMQVLEHQADPAEFLALMRDLGIDRAILTVPRGMPTAGMRDHDGHLSGWVDENDFGVLLRKFGDVTWFEAEPNHMGAVLTWSRP